MGFPVMTSMENSIVKTEPIMEELRPWNLRVGHPREHGLQKLDVGFSVTW